MAGPEWGYFRNQWKRKQSIKVASILFRVSHEHTIWYPSSGSVDESNVKSPNSTKPDSFGWKEKSRKSVKEESLMESISKKEWKIELGESRVIIDGAAGEISWRRNIRRKSRLRCKKKTWTSQRELRVSSYLHFGFGVSNFQRDQRLQVQVWRYERKGKEWKMEIVLWSAECDWDGLEC